MHSVNNESVRAAHASDYVRNMLQESVSFERFAEFAIDAANDISDLCLQHDADGFNLRRQRFEAQCK